MGDVMFKLFQKSKINIDSKETNEDVEKEVLDKSLDKNIAVFKSIFEDDETVIFRKFQNKQLNAAQCCVVHAAVVIANELNNESIGIEYVTLCADPAALEFYLKLDIDFGKLRKDYTLPYEDWNIHCIPLAVRLYN